MKDCSSCSCAAAVLAIAMFATGAPAQEAGRALAEPYLPSDHWSQDALRRLAGLGLVDAGAALDAWPLRRNEVRAWLQAASEAGSRREAIIALDALSRFDAEYPAPGVAPFAMVRLRTGWIRTDDALRAGETVRDEMGKFVYPGPVRAPEQNDVRAGAVLDGGWRRLTAALGATTAGEDKVEEAWAAFDAGPLDIWAGRRSLGFGAARAGTIVLAPRVPLDGVGIRTSRALHLPGFLGALGSVRGAMLVSRFESSGDVENPWFWAASLRLSPTAGFSIGLNRAAIFGGADNVQSMSARNVALMLMGLTSQLGKDSGFENQVASLDVWARTRAAGVPLAVYGEIGIDDVGFSLFKAASFVAGIELPAVPGVSALSLGLEHARFPASCCGHPAWYRHGSLGSGWTDGGRLLANSLGGHGSEWTLHWGTATGRITVDGRLFARRRGEENLFAPDREGSSRGIALRLSLPASQSLFFRLAGELEGGNDWHAWSSDIGLQFLVGPRGPALTSTAHQDVRTRSKTD
jgi:hypothetical protein